MFRRTPLYAALIAASPLVFGTGPLVAETIDTWNRDNAVTDLPNWPADVEPLHTPGVTYDSTLFTDTTRLETNGAVIWKEGAVVAPGAQVLTDSPNPGDNCIITSGTNRAIPGAIPKTCTDAFQSAKRVKLEARLAGDGDIVPDPDGSIDLIDGKPLDMVFNVSAPDDVARTYRVFKKYINATSERVDGFVVELGFGTGDGFVASTPGDGLRFTKRQQGQNPNPNDFALPFYSTPPGNSDLGSLMSAGLFGDAADNQNRTVDGYFYLPGPTIPDENELDCATDPSGTGRSYYNLVVRTEDRIETVGNVQGLHYCLFGNMLPQGALPLGYFWDDDGDPVTDADTIADWDGSGTSTACGGTPCWQTYVVLDTDPNSPDFGDPILTTAGNFIRPDNAPVPVPQEIIDYWVANPEVTDPSDPAFGRQFYFITALDDMGLVNNNYHITVESMTTWPTYDAATGTATFTMRTSNVGEGKPFVAPWLETLPPELASPPPAADLAVAAFSVAGDSPTATVDTGDEVPVTVTVKNNAPVTASGRVVGEAKDASGKLYASFLGVFTDLAPGASVIPDPEFSWTVADPTGLPAALTWTVEVFSDGGDPSPDDNTATVDVTITPPPLVDMALDALDVPKNAKNGSAYVGSVTVSNVGDVDASGTITITANNALVATLPFAVAPGGADTLSFDWTAPTVSRPLTVTWVAEVSADGDVNQGNDTLTLTTRVTPGKGRNP
jgi:hypothetical protein